MDDYSPTTFGATKNTLGCFLPAGLEHPALAASGVTISEFQAERLLEAGYVIVHNDAEATRILLGEEDLMPNHITTIITGPQQALASLVNDAGQVDFSYLVPPPVNIETGGCSHVFTFGERVEQPDGTICWYAWNVNNWGTKWNAYDSDVSEGRVQFDTAWSHPFPVMKALAAKHPDVEFEVQYADEDLGSNLAHYKLHGDEIIEYPIVDPLEFAAHIKYGCSYKELQAQGGDDE